MRNVIPLNRPSRDATGCNRHPWPKLRWQVALVMGTTAAAFSVAAMAQDSSTMAANQTFADKFENQVVKGTQVHGRVGIYDFRRWHDLNQPYSGQPATSDDFNNQATNYGAQIQLQTGSIYGFSGGAAFVYESSFYGNNDAGTKLNCNLACGGAVENLTQGYLQFNDFGFQVRAGRQLLNTPLAGADQFTFLPRSFNGITGVFRPLEAMQAGGMFNHPFGGGPQINKPSAQAQTPSESFETNQYMPFSLGASMSSMPEWQLFGGKINRYEGRGNADSFVRNNRYLNDVDGFWFAGTSIQDTSPAGQVIGQYYHYHFDQTENADYGEIGYMTPTIGPDSDQFAPYIRAQAVHAYDVSDSRVTEGIDGDIYGLKIGIESTYVGFSIFGNYSPEHNGSFNDGQLLHPYTDLSGVLYTDTMNDGIQEIGPGWAAGGRIDFTPNDNFSMYARYVQYKAQHGHYHDFYFAQDANGNISDDSFTGNEVNDQRSNAIGIGFTYDMGGLTPQLAGLKIGDNLGYTHFDGAPNFYDNRVRFYYSF